MNWLKGAGKFLLTSGGDKQTGNLISKIFLFIALFIVISAAVVLLLFNVFICTISFGLIGGCDTGNKHEFQVITDKEFEEFGEKMRELREETNKSVDVPGQDFKDYKSVINDELINEAEVFIRALYQTDWYAIQGIDMSDEAMEKRFNLSSSGSEKTEEVPEKTEEIPEAPPSEELTDGDILVQKLLKGVLDWKENGRNGKKITYQLPPRGELAKVYEMDCSSFTQDAFAKFTGIKIGRDTNAQWSGVGEKVDKANLVPGDLVLFQGTYRRGPSHVGIYLGGGKFIHNSSGQNGLAVNSLSEKYWIDHWLGAKRIIGNVSPGLEGTDEFTGENSLSNEKRFIMIWKMAKQLEKKTHENDSWLNKRSKEWKFKRPDWVMTVQFDVYRCYYIGDEKSSFFKPSTWFGMGDAPCQTLDDLYEEAFGEKKEVVRTEDRGVLAHTHTITEETWMCVEIEVPETETPTAFNWFKFDKVFAHHLDQLIERGPAPDCGPNAEAAPGPDIITTYVSYPNLLETLHYFENYTLFTPGVTVEKRESYSSYIDYILRELYGLLFGDSSLVPLPGMTPMNGWLVPMEEGTYHATSLFGWRDLGGVKDFHYGVDLATNKTPQVPIYATRGGIVTFANPDSSSPVGKPKISSMDRDTTGCGGNIIILHDDGSSATYCHMYRSDILVQSGWKVVQGQMIAGVGNNGESTGHHLDIKICLKASGLFQCTIDNSNPEGKFIDYTDPEKEPVNYALNKGSANSSKIKESVKYFNEVAGELAKASESEKEKLANTFLMPGFNPMMGGGALFGQLPLTLAAFKSNLN